MTTEKSPEKHDGSLLTRLRRHDHFSALWPPVGVAVICWSVSILLASPPWLQTINYDPQSSLFGSRFHEVFAKQVEDPFYRPNEQINKAWQDSGNFLAYRIFIPTIAWLLGIGAWGGVSLIWLSGIIATAVLYDLLDKDHVDRRLAFMFLLTLGTTPFLQGSHFYVGFPDSVAWCCVAIMMRFRKPLCWALMTFSGLFNDERLLVALPLAVAVAFYHDRANPFALLRRAIPCAIAVAIGLLAAMVVRYGIRNGSIGGAMLVGADLPHTGGKYPWSMFHTISLLSSYAFLWFLPIAAFAHDRGARLFWGAILAYTVIAVVATTYAFDFWRGLGAIYPLFVLSFQILAKPFFSTRRSLMAWMTLLMLLRPQFFSTGTLKVMRPLPVAIYEAWRGESILSAFKLGQHSE